MANRQKPGRLLEFSHLLSRGGADSHHDAAALPKIALNKSLSGQLLDI